MPKPNSTQHAAVKAKLPQMSKQQAAGHNNEIFIMQNGINQIIWYKKWEEIELVVFN